MVKYSSPSLDHVFMALSDQTRRAILLELKHGHKTVRQLAAPFRLSPSGFSKHLRVLERAGLMTQTKNGRERWCRLVAKPLKESLTWLQQYQEAWTRSAASFAHYAAQLESSKQRTKTN